MTKKKTTSTRKSTKRKATARRKPTRGGTKSRRSTASKSRSQKSKRSRKTTPKRDWRLSLQQKALLSGIVTIFITAILTLSLLSPTQAVLTQALSDLLWRTFGWGGVLMPVILGMIGLYAVLWGMDQPPQLPVYRLLGGGLLFLAVEALASFSLVILQPTRWLDVWAVAQAGSGGGYLGGLLAVVLETAVGRLGAVLTLTFTSLIALILVSGVSRAQLGQWLRDLLTRRPKPAGKTAVAISRANTKREIPINPGRNRQPDSPSQPPLPVIAEDTPTPKPEPAPVKSEPTPKPTSRRKPKPEKPQPEETPTIPTPVFLGNLSRGTHNWKLPPITDILEPGSDQDVSSATIREQVEIIEHTLESFGAPATVVEINQGPTITQFGVEPSFIETRSGKRTKVKVGKIASLADDLALALAARSIRIQAPVPGKGYIGIEIPNTSKALVSLRDVMESPEFQKIKSPLRIGLGQDVAGQPVAADLAAMPHLLIAGTTGSGKSVCVNGIIACLLLQNTPDDLKLVMVDPKRVELTGYNGIPHLAAPVVVDMEKVIGTLQWAMREMDNRYRMFAEVGARNITDYNKKVARRSDADKLPYIVIVIDELADLMMLSPEETERGITRLAQMARATGIHMVIATQRPSVDVVTGLIKANFPARIAFAVASSTDSRVILDTTGAERLLGQGDMLFQSPDAAAPVRLQGCFVSDRELQRLIAYWQTARRFNRITAEDAVPKSDAGTSSQPVTQVATTRSATAAKTMPVATSSEADAPTQPVPKPQIRMKSESVESEVEKMPADVDAPTPERSSSGVFQQPLWEALQEAAEKSQYEDELMPEAIALVRKVRKASTSMLQRRFRIGYTRAARMIDAMEEMGIIGPPTGTSKAREVLLPPEGEETAVSDESNNGQENSHEEESAE
ncbi:MAG: DNA translocase FtsK [Chloroflexi bacterium]|nr:MAG: DNA translocase FtsK [Chloroflexota bacterium]